VLASNAALPVAPCDRHRPGSSAARSRGSHWPSNCAEPWSRDQRRGACFRVGVQRRPRHDDGAGKVAQGCAECSAATLGRSSVVCRRWRNLGWVRMIIIHVFAVVAAATWCDSRILEVSLMAKITVQLRVEDRPVLASNAALPVAPCDRHRQASSAARSRGSHWPSNCASPWSRDQRRGA
jgi:hypothetical protein